MTPTVDADRTWIVECFVPGALAASLPVIGREAISTTARLAADGEPIEYLGATLVPDDEVVLLRFRAPSAAIVRAASRELPIECGRVVESIDLVRTGREEGAARQGRRPSR